ncbi:MAG: DHA2 family efflux MFS transporter permease subunit [Croceibacterium sp.]
MASTAAPRRGVPAAKLRPAPRHDVATLPVANPALLVIGVMAATLMQVLDTTIANVAIPHMQSTLSATPDTISWVLTSYIIASAVAMPITGWLADRIGSRKLFILSVAGFVIASMLCGMAQSLTQMVLFRALQGVAGAFIAPLSQAALLDTTRPSKQGQMIALWGMGVMIGPILGPVLGGWITENWSWRWCFYVNVPVGAACLAIMMAELPSRPIVKRKFDLFGFALIAIALSCLQLLLDRGNQRDWFSSFEICVYGFLIVSCVWIAAIHFVSSADPLFERSLFTNVNFVVALVFMVVIGMVMFATMALLPTMLQGLFRYDVMDTGMALMPRGVGVLVTMQLSAYVMRKGIDARWLVSIGFLIGAWSLYQMAGWSLDVDRYHIILSGFIQGLGIGLVFIPLQGMAFATLPPRLRTDGSSLLNLTRNVGSSIGISIMVTLLTRNTQTSHSDLASHITPAMVDVIDLSALDRFGQYGDAALRLVDAMVSRQAAMIAYIDDFYLMMWLSLASVPLVLIMRKSRGGPTGPPPGR